MSKRKHITHIKFERETIQQTSRSCTEIEVSGNVTVIVGKNGSGKTKLLQAMNAPAHPNCEITYTEGTISPKVVLIPSMGSAEMTEFLQSDDLLALLHYIHIGARIKLADAINTGLALGGLNVVYDQYGAMEILHMQSGIKVDLSYLSLGELTLLYLTLRTFSVRLEWTVLLIDDISTHLHVLVDSMLLDILLTVNPNCQLIVTTNSPALIMKGWKDKVRNLDTLAVCRTQTTKERKTMNKTIGNATDVVVCITDAIVIALQTAGLTGKGKLPVYTSLSPAWDSGELLKENVETLHGTPRDTLGDEVSPETILLLFKKHMTSLDLEIGVAKFQGMLQIIVADSTGDNTVAFVFIGDDVYVDVCLGRQEATSRSRIKFNTYTETRDLIVKSFMSFN